MLSTHESSTSSAAPDPVQPSHPTHFLDLSDDIFGFIHASLDKDRRSFQPGPTKAATAFRHTCRATHRSPAVNSQISHLDLILLEKEEYQSSWVVDDDEEGGKYDDEEGSEEELPEEHRDWLADVADVAHTWICRTAAFPQHAALRSLRISAKQYLRLEMEYLEQLLQRMQESPAVCARLTTVTDLEIQEAELSVGCTTILSEIFPALTGGKLELMGCTVYKSSLCCLSSLQKLSIMSCGFESLADIGMFTQLRSLSLCCMCCPKVDLGCLAQMSSLTSLRLEMCLVSNLHSMLQAVPLRKLSLKGMDWVLMPSGIKFSSGTLHILELHVLEIMHFELSLHDLPSIQRVSIAGIKLEGRCERLQRVHTAAVELSKLPITVHATFSLFAGRGWLAEQQADALQALFPLKPVLSLHVNKLRLASCILDRTSIQALHSLFGSVRYLDVWSSDMIFRDGLFMDIVQGMPSVLCVSLNISDKVPEPQWWVTELLSVHYARREVTFKLIHASNGSWLRDTFQKIFHAWQEALRALPGLSTVRLETFGLSMFGDLEQIYFPTLA